jgi:hypothetical protein
MPERGYHVVVKLDRLYNNMLLASRKFVPSHYSLAVADDTPGVVKGRLAKRSPQREGFGRMIAYTDNSYTYPERAYFLLLEDQLSVGNGLVPALDPTWQALALPGDLSPVISPFSNVNYLE